MKEIITLFNCFPLRSVCSSILPITSENFYLFFIAFLVTFFLLGIIIGYIINPQRRSSKEKEETHTDASKKEPEASADTGQDTPGNGAEQRRGMEDRTQRTGNHYNNYWDYSRPPRRY